MTIFRTIILLITFPVFGQGDYITLTDQTKLYFEESGAGQTLLFIPGWTMTHRFFEHQKAFFSKNYHVFSYDPRGQGLSDKTAFKNTYADHARDLYEILKKRDLEEVVLIGWSSGCLTIWEYIRAYGYEHIDKVVYIDEAPKWIGDVGQEWVYGSFDDYRGSLKDLISAPFDPDGIIDWMLQQPVDSLTRQWMREEMLMTPSQVALSLYVDGVVSDYTAEVQTIDSANPTLFLLRSSWFDEAQKWIQSRAPKAQVATITSHAMFWEESDPFNVLLTDFLNSK